MRPGGPKELWAPTIHANLQIWFAGHNFDNSQVALKEVAKGNELEVSGTIPLKGFGFQITRPELLTMPIKDEVPVSVHST